LLVPEAYLRAGRPDRAFLRRFAWIYGIAAGTAGLFLITYWALYRLLPLALLGSSLAAVRILSGRRNAERGLLTELVGTAGLSLSAPVAWIAATGGFDSKGILVWALNAAFFCCGVLYVKSRLRARRGLAGGGTANIADVTIAFHFAVVLFVVALVWWGGMAPMIVVPFVLATLRAKWGLANKRKAFALPRLGWSEVALSLVFAGFLILSFSL
jgi:hypothetical protein